MLTGARLQLNGVAGYSALEGGRYAGLGTVGLGLFTAGVLLLTGALAQHVGRRWRPAAVAGIGAVAIVVVGSPYLGADAGGAVALTAGVCLAAAICTGGWVTFARLAWATLAGIAVTAGFALLDLQRPVADRGRLGQLLSDASGGDVLTGNPSTPNVFGFNAGPLTLVALGAVVLAAIGMLAPWGGLKRVFGLYPSIRAALVGITVAALIGGLVDGVGFMVAGAAAATAVPLAALAALRVLDHADDRSVAIVVSATVPPDFAPPATVEPPPEPPTEPDDHRDTDAPATLALADGAAAAEVPDGAELPGSALPGSALPGVR